MEDDVIKIDGLSVNTSLQMEGEDNAAYVLLYEYRIVYKDDVIK